MDLPPLPCPVSEFVSYVNKHSQSQAGVAEAGQPFINFESKLREVYAQHPGNSAATANHLVSIFENDPVTIRARDLPSESTKEKEKYLLPLPDHLRRENGSPATVGSLKEFKTNFNLFSESSLADLDWSNVVVAGSAAVTSLLPLDAPHNESKRALRAYYHEKLAPASDVDLFLYGLDEEQAVEKIKQIESTVRDSILAETTTVRTKNAITIVSEYPTRHVQIVLRLYKSVSEILTGFDVDCSCVAYDGQRVWASPRALAAFVTQVNTIDLTRRSPSYENRLSKYSHRGFEVVWPAIDRKQVDPTIFERSFSRVQGLARLLVLEKLPHPDDRDAYLAQRRKERGRPALPWQSRNLHELPGNVKDAQPDDVAEWVEEDEVSNYHTVGIPYGPAYTAKRIEKLLFTKDLLLNAEWNKSKSRETKLHRHPVFFGSVNDVIHDCCGFCPEPTTDEDFAALEEESKIYISGDISFLKDDPGRQAIGSFNPITDEDWTEMAYVGNTTRLCEAIVEQDVDAVRDWFSSPDVVDVNSRDHTGRTPLHLAVMCSSPDVVRYLIDHGARLVSRLYNGMTALHLAAHRGEVQMIVDLLEKSEFNEEQESIKQEAKRVARRTVVSHAPEKDNEENEPSDSESFDSDEDIDVEEDDDDKMTEGSFVKVGQDATVEDRDEPDFYDVDVLAWDSPLSPLHLAILAGHTGVIDVLIDKYSADVLLPVKILEENDAHTARYANPRGKTAKAVILTLVLALQLPLQQANQVVKDLLVHGATSTQADMNYISAIHYAISDAKTLILDTLRDADASAFSKACNFLAVSGRMWNADVQTPLLSAIRTGKMDIVERLVAEGTKTHIDFESFAEAYKHSTKSHSDNPDEIKKIYRRSVEQPIIIAMNMEMIDFVSQLVDQGEDVNTLSKHGYQCLDGYYWSGEGRSLLELVQGRIKSLQEFSDPFTKELPLKPEPLHEDEAYLTFSHGSYQYWTAYHDLREAKLLHQYQMEQYEKELASLQKNIGEGSKEKEVAVKNAIFKLVELEKKLINKGAKPFDELHKDTKDQMNRQRYFNSSAAYKNVPYGTKISFRVAGLTSEKKVTYVKLFEAAWTGDVDTVKSLCLSGSHPLQVAVMDLRGFSPFSIASLRGHYELAQLVVQIATVQYQPDENSVRYHYALQAEEYSDYEGSDSDYSGDGESVDQRREIRVLAQIIDENFTVADITTLADNVKSKVSPDAMVAWECQVGRARRDMADGREADMIFTRKYTPYAYVGENSKQSWAWFNVAYGNVTSSERQSLVRYAIFTDNRGLLAFLLRIGNNLALQKEDEENLRVTEISKQDFELAVRMGRVEMIGEILRTTGHGLPLQTMFQKSGIKLDEKPKFYQGLTVHGQKRQDWADAGRKGTRRKTGEADAGIPLLVSAVEGNTETTEYFLSEAPLRRYLEFAETFKNDKRIQALAQAKGGIRGAVISWLSTRNNLALHMGILSSPKQDGSQPVFDFLLDKIPSALGARSINGSTPLQLAFEVGRYYAAKQLIAAGANQTTKDDAGQNVLHIILKIAHTQREALLRSVLGMLDQKIIAPLLLERSGGLTPLAMFLDRLDSLSGSEASLKLILSFSHGKDLEKMNDTGDYPLHSLVRRGHRDLVEFVVEYRPGLLYWENATGMTPSEVATTSYLGRLITNPPRLVGIDKASLVDVSAKEFAKKNDCDFDVDDDSERSSEWRMYRLIQSLMAKYPGKRKLVTLHDANEVAKRLATQQQKKNEESREKEGLGTGASFARKRRGQGFLNTAPTETEEQDDVTQCLPRAKQSAKWDELLWRKAEAGEVTGENGLVVEKEYSGSDRPSLEDMKKNPFFEGGQTKTLAVRHRG